MTNIDQLGNEILRQLQQYGKALNKDIHKASEITAEELVQDLKGSSPKRKGRGGGKYSKGWKIQSYGENKIVYNKKYMLTHLLEKGHAKRGGGRVNGIPHIAPAEEKAVNKFIGRVEDAIRQ